MYSDNNRWLIQVPRLYDIYRANNNVKKKVRKSDKKQRKKKRRARDEEG